MRTEFLGKARFDHDEDEVRGLLEAHEHLECEVHLDNEEEKQALEEEELAKM